MAEFITLTEFIPGTKAKAEEVNQNFQTLKTAVEKKADLNGDLAQSFEVADATLDNQAISKRQLDSKAVELEQKIKGAATRFCAKKGNVISGIADLFSVSSMTITFKVGGEYEDLTVSNCNGEVSTFSSVDALDLSGSADGEYNIFINSSGSAYALKNAIYKQTTRPVMLTDDIWLNTSVEPLSAIKFNGTSDDEFLDVPLGKVTVASSAIADFEVFRFNQNGYDVNQNTVKKYDSGWFAVSSAQTYTKTHNLGTDKIKYSVLMADNTDGANAKPAIDYMYGGSTDSRGYIPYQTTSTTVSIKTSNKVGYSASGSWVTSAYYKILVEVI